MAELILNKHFAYQMKMSRCLINKMWSSENDSKRSCYKLQLNKLLDYQDDTNNICLFSRVDWYAAVTFAHY